MESNHLVMQLIDAAKGRGLKKLKRRLRFLASVAAIR